MGHRSFCRCDENSPPVCAHTHISIGANTDYLHTLQEPLQTRCLKPCSGPVWRPEPCTPHSLWDQAQVHRILEFLSSYCLLCAACQERILLKIFFKGQPRCLQEPEEHRFPCDIRELSPLLPKNKRKEGKTAASSNIFLFGESRYKFYILRKPQIMPLDGTSSRAVF